MNIILSSTDDRLEAPKEQKEGVYYVVKKYTVGKFTFGKDISEYKTIEEAHKALVAFLSNRKDADELNVQLLNTHF